MKQTLTADDYSASPSEVSSLDGMSITFGGLPDITAESGGVDMYIKAQYHDGNDGGNYTITESSGDNIVTRNVVTKGFSSSALEFSTTLSVTGDELHDSGATVTVGDATKGQDVIYILIASTTQAVKIKCGETTIKYYVSFGDNTGGNTVKDTSVAVGFPCCKCNFC